MHDWTPSDVVTIIAALSAFAVSVINALKNTQAKTRADDNQERLSSLVRHVQNHDQQLTTLALSIPAGGGGSQNASSGPQSGGYGPPNGGAQAVPPPSPGAVASDGGTAVPSDSQTDLIAPQGADAEVPQ